MDSLAFHSHERYSLLFVSGTNLHVEVLLVEPDTKKLIQIYVPLPPQVNPQTVAAKFQLSLNTFCVMEFVGYEKNLE